MAPFNLNMDVIKKIPPKQKAMIVGLFYLLLAAAYYFLVLQSSFEAKESLQTKLSELQEQVTEKERLAVQKNKYIRELREREGMLRMALTKLPDQREIPGLLYSVAQAGRDCGINFTLFEPKQAEKKAPEKQPAAKPGDKKPPSPPQAGDKKPPSPPQAGAKPTDKKPGDKGVAAKATDEKFYEDIPVKVIISGSYQNTALFFEKVARLPRIINIEEIIMSEGKDAKGRGRLLNTSCVIKTYMFVEKMDEKKA
ncbi:MAG: type 4a pilus biogenesis protein PilO, partial [Deltaproteobacteria bacterium]|nr:type 4a pilus biogenesis protein PilO [Deltaproteobacteria bacterium]